jgi:hypothetical protein
VINFITKIRGEFGKLCNGYYGEIGEVRWDFVAIQSFRGPCCGDAGFDEWDDAARPQISSGGRRDWDSFSDS